MGTAPALFKEMTNKLSPVASFRAAYQFVEATELYIAGVVEANC